MSTWPKNCTPAVGAVFCREPDDVAHASLVDAAQQPCHFEFAAERLVALVVAIASHRSRPAPSFPSATFRPIGMSAAINFQTAFDRFSP
jgi:hypothetical protein